MPDIDKTKTYTLKAGQSAVIEEKFGNWRQLDPVIGYEPAINDLLAVKTTDSKHYKFNTATASLVIDGVITEYNAETKLAYVVTRGTVLLVNLNIAIEDGKTGVVELAMRQLGLDLV